MRISLRTIGLATGLAVTMAAGPAVLAEDDGWKDTAEFSFVLTDGNSESSSLGLKNVLWRDWAKSRLTFKAGGIRVESTTSQTVTAGSDDVNNNTETTAENYFFNARYDRKITDRFFWYVGAGWDKNEFAGIDSRYIYDAGVGNIWRDTDDLKFSTSYGVTFTDQEDVIPDPSVDDTFAGWRVGWNYENKLGKVTRYTNVLVVDGNLDESSDWRADMDNGLAVAMSERLALRLGLQFLYDAEPSLGTFTEVDASGVETGNMRTVQLDELDTIFTASLVVNFK